MIMDFEHFNITTEAFILFLDSNTANGRNFDKFQTYAATREVKETPIYPEFHLLFLLPQGYLDKYCDYVGIDVSTFDYILEKIDPFFK